MRPFPPLPSKTFSSCPTPIKFSLVGHGLTSSLGNPTHTPMVGTTSSSAACEVQFNMRMSTSGVLHWIVPFELHYTFISVSCGLQVFTWIKLCQVDYNSLGQHFIFHITDATFRKEERTYLCWYPSTAVVGITQESWQPSIENSSFYLLVCGNRVITSVPQMLISHTWTGIVRLAYTTVIIGPKKKYKLYTLKCCHSV